MKKVVFLLMLTPSLSFALKTIYQDSTNGTCTVVHLQSKNIEYFDLDSSPNLLGEKLQIKAVHRENAISLEGSNFQSFCSNGKAQIKQVGDAVSVQCEDSSEGEMLIRHNSNGSLQEVLFHSSSQSASCKNLKVTDLQ